MKETHCELVGPTTKPLTLEMGMGVGAFPIGNKGGCFPGAHRILQREHPCDQKGFSGLRPGNGSLHLGLDSVPC